MSRRSILFIVLAGAIAVFCAAAFATPPTSQTADVLAKARPGGRKSGLATNSGYPQLATAPPGSSDRPPTTGPPRAAEFDDHRAAGRPPMQAGGAVAVTGLRCVACGRTLRSVD